MIVDCGEIYAMLLSCAILAAFCRQLLCLMRGKSSIRVGNAWYIPCWCLAHLDSSPKS